MSVTVERETLVTRVKFSACNWTCNSISVSGIFKLWVELQLICWEYVDSKHETLAQCFTMLDHRLRCRPNFTTTLWVNVMPARVTLVGVCVWVCVGGGGGTSLTRRDRPYSFVTGGDRRAGRWQTRVTKSRAALLAGGDLSCQLSTNRRSPGDRLLCQVTERNERMFINFTQGASPPSVWLY